jgi:hypothetical protein
METPIQQSKYNKYCLTTKFNDTLDVSIIEADNYNIFVAGTLAFYKDFNEILTINAPFWISVKEIKK